MGREFSSKHSEPRLSYFELQSQMGISKHGGSLRSTDVLVEFCHIHKDSLILDVRCGVGITPCYLAKKYGCRVVAIDISEEMIEWGKQRAKRDGVEDKLKFMIADAQKLPFPSNHFDAVLSESVTAFVPDQKKAMKEYVRVVKKGGYVGLNEGTWTTFPLPADVKEKIDLIYGKVKFFPREGWVKLMTGAGLKNILVKTYPFDSFREFFDEMTRLGFWNLIDFIKAWFKFISLSFSSPAYWDFMKKVMPAVKPFLTHWGYGLYVGRK